MSHNHDTRSLRLERLESRTLLAGGIFDFSPTDHAPGRRVDGYHDNHLQRTAEFSRNGSHQLRSAEDARRNAGSERNRGPQQRNHPPQAIPQNQSFALTLILAPPSTSAPTTVLGTSNAPGRTSIGETNNSAATGAAPRRSLTTDAAIASLTGIEAIVTADGVTDQVIAAPISTIQTDAASRFVIKEQVESNQPIAVATVPHVGSSDTGSHSTDEGLLELTPQSLSAIPSDDAGNTDEPWRLRSDTLPLLRHVLEASPQDRVELADQMMNDWFGGPGGMIALDGVALPTINMEIDNAIIDVRLESTVMLHRSLELIAGGTVSPLSGPALDAIMASLAEAATSEVQPIAKAVAAQVPVAAYPAIAAITTGLAISARRKQMRKHLDSNLQVTKPR